MREEPRIVDGRVMVGDREMTRIYEPDDPLVLDGTYDIYGFKPAERRALEREAQHMAKSKPNGKANGHGKKGERSQPLPGMEQVRSKRLDNLCESIAEHRATMNAARTEEQSDISAALHEMQKKGIHTFKHNGVELARVPGAEKLRVRLTKDHGDAGDEDLDDTGREYDEERSEAVAAE